MRAAEKIALALVLGVLALDGSRASAGEPRPPDAPRRGENPVAVKGIGEGRIRLTRASQKLVLDLGREISGCKGRLYDPMTKEESEGGVGFEVVDETEKAPYTYVVLFASANPNCNVQGECGAGGEDITLVWLKLTRDLTPAGRQTFAVADCRAGRSVKVEGKDGADLSLQAKDLLWTGDRLQIEYYEQAGSSGTMLRRLIYDRQYPDAGLQKIPGGEKQRDYP